MFNKVRKTAVFIPGGLFQDRLKLGVHFYSNQNLSHASYEFDFGSKWTEAVGQSSYYSMQTKKKPGIVLILETMKDRKYWIPLNTTIEHFNLQIDILE